MASTSAFAIILAACGGSSAAGPAATATVPSGLGITSFDASFSAMAQLKTLVGAGRGKVAVILPDATTSGRYVTYDQPMLQKAFDLAGYTSSQYKIDNAKGDPATELALAQADISAGATVLVFDPLDSTVGASIQQYAQSHGVKTISYDRATFQGTNVYYISFDNVQVGKLIGQGFLDCVKAWNITNPQVFTLDGGQNSDPNAISFAQGYNGVVWGKADKSVPDGTTNNGLTLVAEKVATDWTNSIGGTIFAQQFTAHPNINATIEANDGLGNAVIQVLKSRNVPAKKIPTTGQDATLDGMANTLTGYQCGSVYKPIYLEAQDAVAIATILRAGLTVPASLINGTTSPPTGAAGTQQPASLLVPYWVTTANMNTTVIKDNFVDKTALCAAAGAAACTAAGIS
jgi:D-xylose transport system substrate-binding protein